MASTTLDDIALELSVSNETLGLIREDLGVIFDGIMEVMGSTLKELGERPGNSGGGSFSPEVSLGNAVGSTMKASAFSVLTKIMPGLVPSAQSGFRQMASAASPLGNKRSQAGIEGLKKLSEAFTSFSSVKWASVLVGLGIMKMFGSSLKGVVSGVMSMRQLSNKKPRETIEAFSQFSSAIETFGNTKWGSVLVGLGIMKMFGPAFASFGALSQKIGDASKTFSEAGSSIGQIVTGFFKTLTGAKKDILIGSVLIGAIALGIAALAGSFMLLGLVKWDAVFLGAVALGVFAAGAVILGSLMESGLLELGIIAIGALGIALVPFGIAALMAGEGVKLLGEGMALMADAVIKAVEPLLKLAMIAPLLYVAAGGIAAVSVAMASFALGQTGSAIAGFFSNLLGGKGPIDQLKALADMGPGLEKTANAMDRINGGLRGKPSTAGADLNKINSERGELSVARAGVESGPDGSGAIDLSSNPKAITNNVSSMIVNNGWTPDRSTALVLAPAM